MSVQVLCPACGAVAEVHRPPVTECVRCGTPLPESLRLATERALLRSQTPKPLLLTIGQWGSLFVGSIFLFVLLLAPFDLGTFRIGEEAVSGPEFLRRAGWVFGIIGGLLFAIGVGLWRERAWARPLIVLYWLSLLLVGLTAGEDGAADLAGTLITAVLGAAVAAWYVYRKPNVRAYFEARAEPTSTRGGV